MAGNVNNPKIDTDILAYGIWHSVINKNKLPKNIYQYNADKLAEGIFKGYKRHPLEIHINAPDEKMLRSLNDNVHIFSAAKTYQQTKEMSELLHKVHAAKVGDVVKTDNATVEIGNSKFSDFKSGVKQISDIYNDTWLETEYKTSISGSRNASLWQRIDEQKQTLPYLTYHTDEQDTVCEICAPLDLITLPADDPFWDEYYPDNHFNCNCYVSQEDDTAEVTNESDVSEATDKTDENIQPMWKRNVGKNGEIFTKQHPYFSVPSEDRKLARQNFNLKIGKSYNSAWQL